MSYHVSLFHQLPVSHQITEWSFSHQFFFLNCLQVQLTSCSGLDQRVLIHMVLLMDQYDYVIFVVMKGRGGGSRMSEALLCCVVLTIGSSTSNFLCNYPSVYRFCQ